MYVTNQKTSVDICSFLERTSVDICGIYTHIHASERNVILRLSRILFLNLKLGEYMSSPEAPCHGKWYLTLHIVSFEHLILTQDEIPHIL